MPPILFAFFIILIWYGVHHFVLNGSRKIVLPPPHTVLTKGFFVGENVERIWNAFLQTSYLSFVGLVVAIIIGTLLAVLMTLSIRAERAIFPWAVVLQVVPVFALIPIINIWFTEIDPWFLGFDREFKKRLIVCVLIALFPIIINSYFGFKSVSRSLHDLFSLHNSGRIVRFSRLEFRAAIPSIFVGLRVAAGLSVVGAIVAEFLFSRGPRGIGTIISRFSGTNENPALIATILVSSAMGIGIFWMFTFVGNALTRHWHATARDLAR